MPTKSEKFVIVHIPKAAGSSLKESIAEQFGAAEIYFDYHKPLSIDPALRKLQCMVMSLKTGKISQRIIFGHFLAGKYAQFSGEVFQKRQDWRYITFLRDPLQRAISHYHFWKRTDDSQHRVWRRFSKENWSLERFLLSKEHENFQSQFLWRFPITNFDFIGLTERFEESMGLLGNTFPEFAGISLHQSNLNPERQPGTQYTVAPELEKEFKRLNSKDYALYDQALLIFDRQQRCLKQSAT